MICVLALSDTWGLIENSDVAWQCWILMCSIRQKILIIFCVLLHIICISNFCPVPAGVVPAVWQALPLPWSCPPVSHRSPVGAGWLPMLPGVCPATRRTLHRDVSLRQPERTAVWLQCQLPWEPWGVCRWVPLLTSKQAGPCLCGWDRVEDVIEPQSACMSGTNRQLMFRVCSAERDCYFQSCCWHILL